MRKRFNGFTLMEIMIVIVIIGVIAGFSIPNYSRSIAKAHERNVIANLKALRAGLRVYISGGGTIGPGNWNGLATINSNLKLGVTDPNATYSCGPSEQCQATLGAWRISFDNTNSNFLYCSSGGCPTCAVTPLVRDCQ